MKFERQGKHHVTRNGIIPSFSSTLSIDTVRISQVTIMGHKFLLLHNFPLIIFEFRLNWTKEYYGFQPGTVLVDNATGKKYKLRKVQGLPMKDLFFIHGVAGDMFAMVLLIVYSSIGANRWASL